MDHNGKAVRLLRAWQENYTRQTFISAALSCGCTALFALYHGTGASAFSSFCLLPSGAAFL